jgi:hypothetical protein
MADDSRFVPLHFKVDHAEFKDLISRIISRLNELGREESERRLGCTLEQLMRDFRNWIDIVPSETLGVVSVQPSVRFDETLAALG